MKILLLGAPSAGKGTYASRLKEIYNLPHISAGDLLRDAIKEKNEFGLQAKELMDHGKLVPNEIILKLLKKRLEKKDTQKGFLLDGFPRTSEQAKMMQEISELDKVLNFDLDKQVIIDRCAGRIICKDCGEIFHLKKIIPKVAGICDKCQGELYQRDDDKPEILEKRLNLYHKQTAPLIQFYKDKGILEVIPADVDIRDPNCRIIEDCCEVLDKLKE